MPIQLKKKKIQTFRYTPNAERLQNLPEGERTVFVFRDLPHSEMLDIRDDLMSIDFDDRHAILRPLRARVNVLVARLVGIENLLDEDGVEIKLPTTKQGKIGLLDAIDQADPQLLQELLYVFATEDGKGKNNELDFLGELGEPASLGTKED